MKNMTISNLVKASKGTYFGPEGKLNEVITGVVRDNREVQKGNLFVPFKGEKVDAHRFIGQAYEAGASVVLSEYDLTEQIKEWKLDENFAYIKVESCPQALKDLAAFYRTQLTCPIIGVVGSVGKTSTKEMIASVLATKYCVQKTAGNYNNEVGLPLTIFSIRQEHEVAVVEMGISDFDEMTRLSKIAYPDMVVMTNIGYCHLEALGDRDGILKAKSEVIPFITPGGALIVNKDDDKLVTIEKPEGIDLLGYGLLMGDAYAKDVETMGTDSVKATFCMNEQEFTAVIPLAGEHNVYNALAAICVGSRLGLTMEQMKQGIENVPVVKGRNNQIEKDGVVVIDDCYNANPGSMKASLKVLSGAKGRKIAVLGDMGELGTTEKELHYEVGQFAATCGIDVLCCVGTLAKEIEKGAKDSDEECALDNEEKKEELHTFAFDTKEDLIEFLLTYKSAGDTILVKASHFMQFEQIVEALTK